eukprot:NODE_7908_length_734_cov_123.296236_g7656_i0.p1 GENE.NODE_7908_length_734_cov_123.296236_g7656_i0~~NODE_7908_length_734_cov_123.296236_g7656_i0.p1  ORF type:complete len:173 (+),score=17.74 NODE_7908_length_734_cov_123.296236_g7656_i0:78-596(+)
MQIFVQALDGRTVAVDVEETATILEAKASIAAATKIPVDELQLVSGVGRLQELNGRTTLADYGLTRHSTLRAVLQLRGGAGMGMESSGSTDKSPMLARILCLCALHRCYLGYPGVGCVYFATLNLFQIGGICDCLHMDELVDLSNMARGLPFIATTSAIEEQRSGPSYNAML